MKTLRFLSDHGELSAEYPVVRWERDAKKGNKITVRWGFAQYDLNLRTNRLFNGRKQLIWRAENIETARAMFEELNQGKK